MGITKVITLERMDDPIKKLLSEEKWEDAFGLIVKEYSKPLYFQARNILGDHQEADDALQNAFIKIWSALPKFKSDSKVYTWAYRIVTNQSLDQLRKIKRRGQSVSLEDHTLESETGDVFFDEDQAYASLVKAVENLPEKQKLVFTMKYFQELTFAEIAEILGGSIGGLKASYHHAVKKLKTNLSLALNDAEE